MGNVFWIVLLLFSFFFNHHHGLKLAFMFLLIILTPLFAPAIDILGFSILTHKTLEPLFTAMYNMPFVPFTGFNNTLVAGGLAAGLILHVPVYFLLLPLIHLYRNTLSPKIRKSKLVMTISKFPLFSLVDKAVRAYASGT
jgi:uncharacterized protein (TIGR03546 family)